MALFVRCEQEINIKYIFCMLMSCLEISYLYADLINQKIMILKLSYTNLTLKKVRVTLCLF